jgi:hypothetical protein
MGRVFPCCHCHDDDMGHVQFESMRQRMVLGNVREHSFRDIWEGRVGGDAALRARSDPVDVAANPCCGLCHEYVRFRKADRLVKLARRVRLPV